jgi:hypothetical protein
MSPLAAAIRAAPPLLGATVRRMLREGMVRRALGFPIVITVATLLVTMTVVAVYRGTPTVFVGPTVDDVDRAALRAQDLWVREVPDPLDALDGDLAVAAFDGTTLVVTHSRHALRAEGALRERRGAWRLRAMPLPGPRFTALQGDRIAGLLAAIYALYGVVFGAGMVARDRDDTSLEVELALPVPKGVHGVVRWIAAAGMLSAWVALSLTLTWAFLGLTEPGPTMRDAIAAAILAVGLGLASVGRAGLRSGFAGSLAMGLSLTTGLLGLGWFLPDVGAWLPLASIVTGGGGWAPLGLSVVLGGLAVAVFTWRSARA